MTRKQKVEMARGMRRAGATYAEIASIMDASLSTATRWINDPTGKGIAEANRRQRSRA